MKGRALTFRLLRNSYTLRSSLRTVIAWRALVGPIWRRIAWHNPHQEMKVFPRHICHPDDCPSDVRTGPRTSRTARVDCHYGLADILNCSTACALRARQWRGMILHGDSRCVLARPAAAYSH